MQNMRVEAREQRREGRAELGFITNPNDGLVNAKSEACLDEVIASYVRYLGCLRQDPERKKAYCETPQRRARQGRWMRQASRRGAERMFVGQLEVLKLIKLQTRNRNDTAGRNTGQMS